MYKHKATDQQEWGISMNYEQTSIFLERFGDLFCPNMSRRRKTEPLFPDVSTQCHDPQTGV